MIVTWDGLILYWTGNSFLKRELRKALYKTDKYVLTNHVYTHDTLHVMPTTQQLSFSSPSTATSRYWPNCIHCDFTRHFTYGGQTPTRCFWNAFAEFSGEITVDLGFIRRREEILSSILNDTDGYAIELKRQMDSPTTLSNSFPHICPVTCKSIISFNSSVNLHQITFLLRQQLRRKEWYRSNISATKGLSGFS